MICKYCGKNIKTESRLRDHIRKLHPDKFKEEFIDNDNLKEKCEVCGERFDTLEKLLSHIKKHKKIISGRDYFNKYVKKPCKYCGKILTYDNRVSASFCSQSHCNSYRKEKNGKIFNYKCEICSSKYDSLMLLGHHITTVHKETITTEDYYKKYINTNDDGKCLWCGKQLKFVSLTLGYNSFCYNTDCNVRWNNKNTNRLNKFSDSFKQTFKDKPENFTVKLEYWIKKGYTKEEAKRKLSDRQTTFSKKICIEKHGEEEGLKIWNDRQDKWLTTINNKTDEEIKEINRKKFLFNGYSNVSQKVFWYLYKKIKTKYNKIYFATLDQKTKQTTKTNNEYLIFTKNRRCRFLDFYIKDINKCIEFDGTYWHGRVGRGNKNRDEIREKEILETNPDMKILHIKEEDYKYNKEDVLNKCMKFINE